MYVEAIMDHGCEELFGVVAMECKKNMPKCMSESDRERMIKGEKGRMRKKNSKHFTPTKRRGN